MLVGVGVGVVPLVGVGVGVINIQEFQYPLLVNHIEASLPLIKF